MSRKKWTKYINPMWLLEQLLYNLYYFILFGWFMAWIDKREEQAYLDEHSEVAWLESRPHKGSQQLYYCTKKDGVISRNPINYITYKHFRDVEKVRVKGKLRFKKDRVKTVTHQ